VIDLTQDEEAILKDMKSTNRNLHRNIAKKGVEFTSSTDPDDVDVLLRFLDATAERKDFNRQQDDYLREAARSLMPLGAATLYVARLEGEPIGASLVYDSDDTRTYAHAAMDFEHRKLSAGIPLVVRMVLDAKHKGLSRFDLFGTAPEDAGPEHEWYGFTKFKKSFGGRPESYPGTWDLPVSRAGYAAYTGVRAAREAVSAARKELPALVEKARAGTGRARSGAATLLRRDGA
jgi:lipid II:glycine glycyltransferase (peptidoglycan interpeptide bridge formation enzyme)